MKAYNYPLIQSYHDYACDKETALPDNTRDDLNTDGFFAAILEISHCPEAIVREAERFSTQATPEIDS